MRRFVMIPWELYVRYDLDPVAREAYGILRGRWDLSLQDADTWRDERGIYCVYPRDELRGVIGCSEPTLRRALRDLQEARWNLRGLSCKYYTTTLHKGAFYLPAYVEELLKNVE